VQLKVGGMAKWLLGLALVLGLGAASFVLSPLPGVLIIRAIFNHGAATASDRLQDIVPPEVTTTTAAYDPGDASAVLDIYRLPDAVSDLPVVVWVHGGGFVSGRREDVANYLKILAGQGMTVVNVDYTIAPGATYPSPVQQVTTALSHLVTEQEQLGIDASRIVLAGDSAGAQIAAQTAAVLSNPEYARRVGVPFDMPATTIAGALLFCGVYDIREMGRDGGFLGWFVHTAGWAYSGTRNWREDEGFASINFLPYLTASFPPAFISAGNADPLEAQSVALADALEELGVAVERLFWPADYQPALGHEYQFDLTTDAGAAAFEKAVEWLSQL
jgi:acetyl esterase